MMKKVLVVMLVLGLASAANAGMTAGQMGTIGVGEISEILVGNDADGAYAGWLEIPDPSIADFNGDPAFTPAGDPKGDSVMTGWPDFGAWYEFTVASLDPSNPIVAGDHIAVSIIGVALGETVLNVYADDGATLLVSSPIVVPEPITIALLGVGGLFLRRRR